MYTGIIRNLPRIFIERKYNYFKSRVNGFEAKDEKERSDCAYTITTPYGSGWDCSSRFENLVKFYNPIDLNSLLYGLKKLVKNLQ